MVSLPVVLSAFRIKPGKIRVRLSRRSGYRWANIKINGIEKGRVYKDRIRSFRIRMRRGRLRRKVRVEIYRGRSVHREVVSVRTRRTVFLRPVLKRRRSRRGRLTVTFHRRSRYRSARLYINSKYRGVMQRGQSKTLRLRRGQYTVELRGRRRTVRKTVTVRSGSTEQVTLRFRSRRGRLTVTFHRRSRYRSARLYINSKYRGVMQRGQSKTLRLRRGQYTVELRGRRRTVRKTVTVRSGRTEQVTLRFRSRRGRLTVTFHRRSRYRSARLYINSKYRGVMQRGQSKTLRLRRGQYTVELRQRRRKVKRVVTIRSGESRQVTLRLRRRFFR